MTGEVCLARVAPERYPYMRESAATHMVAGYDPAAEFSTSQDVVIDALGRRRESG